MRDAGMPCAVMYTKPVSWQARTRVRDSSGEVRRERLMMGRDGDGDVGFML